MQSSNTNPTNEIFDISYSYKKQINKIWHHIKLSANSDPLQLEASKKPNPTKLQMFHNYFLNWLIVFIKKPSHFLFFIIPQRDKNILICTFFYCRCLPSFGCEFDDRRRKRNISSRNRNLHWKLGQQTPSVGTFLAFLETTA